MAGKTRVRWKCTCGSSLFDDFTELRPGAARELEAILNSSSQQGPINHAQPTNTGNHMPSQSSSTVSSGLSNLAFAQSSKPLDPTSGTSYDPRLNNGRPTSATVVCSPESKWLLVCAQAAQRPTSLIHMDVGSTASDQQLFEELLVRSIRFVQFELHPRDLVDVRKTPDMPPEAKKDEYLYQPCDLLPPGAFGVAGWFVGLATLGLGTLQAVSQGE
ncbi:MAG: hypothetical protein Q9213_004558 [Squamulea squamosa]